MSYASDCKQQLIKNRRSDVENTHVLKGMLTAGGKVEGDNIVFSSTSSAIMNYLLLLIKKLYKIELNSTEGMIQSQKFLKFYAVNVPQNLIDLTVDMNELADNMNLAGAFCCGAFLARGSVNDPETFKYHFELSLDQPNHAVLLQQAMNAYDFNAKIIKKRNRFLVYIKDAEKIVDILRFIGVTKLAFTFEEIRIDRDMNNSINRIINCEIANEQKALTSAREQLRYIRYLEYNYPLEKLSPKLLTIMKIRKDHPEASLMELIEVLKEEYGIEISKPGLCHRFAKIKEIAIEHNKKSKKTKRG